MQHFFSLGVRIVASSLLFFVCTAHAYREIIVAADGSGDFMTIQASVDAVPDHDDQLHLIRIQPGVYREVVRVSSDKGPIRFVGSDAATTVLTYNNDATTLDESGKAIGTSRSASVFIDSNDFSAEGITFENTYGKGSQALAIHVTADRVIFRNCKFLGWQDTVLLNRGRQYFEDCLITGYVDFIFGGAMAFFENCDILCLDSGYITAASTPESQAHGFVFSNCRIRGANTGVKTYLGRPWRPDAHVAFLNCEMSEVVRAEGWDNWGNADNEQSARFLEFGNIGGGAVLDQRVPWAQHLRREVARAHTPQRVLRWWDPNHAVSLERISQLSPESRLEWEHYLAQSTRRAQQDHAAMDEELRAAGMKQAMKPPGGGEFKMPSDADQSWYRSDEAKGLAAVMVSFQTPSGGWSKNLDFTAGPRQPAMHWSASAWHYMGTFDNYATTEQLRLIAKVYSATQQRRLRDSFVEGLDYVLAAQFPNGGWPQVYPLEGGYHDNITYNDNAMLHILQLLSDIATQRSEFSFVDRNTRKLCDAAFKKGVRCIFATQVVQDGRPTVWCAQHDPISLAPVAARRMEPASLSGGESAEIVRYLMDLDINSRTLDGSITAAKAWYRNHQMTGIRRDDSVQPKYFVSDPAATEVYWARFYHLETDQPVFAGPQDGFIYDDFETMASANRVGYDFYVNRPARLLELSAQR